MTDLPSGWEWTTLGEIADTSLGKMLDQGKSSGRDMVGYLRNVNVQWGKIDTSDILTMEIPPSHRDRFAVRNGDLLVCEGGEIGRCAIWQGERDYIAFQKALHRVRPYSNINARFIRYFFGHLSDNGSLIKYATGSTIKHLPQQQLRRVALPLPPLAEQRRIVAALETHLSRLDAAARQLRSIQTRTTWLRDNIMGTACMPPRHFCGQIAAALPPVGLVDGDLPALPATWRWARLGSIADVVSGITKDSKKASTSAPGLPYLRVANVQRGFLDLSHVATVRVERSRAESLFLQSGDVLLNEGGDRDKLGRGWVWEDQVPNCIHQNHVFRARIRDAIIMPKLLSWHANGLGRSWFQRNGKQSVNLASISLSKIRLFPVPIPPREEQEDLVRKTEQLLATLGFVERTLEQAESRVSHLRQSLLAEAFAGRLVPQDPEDEPASVLLERVRRERAAAKKPRRRSSGKARGEGTLL